MNELKEIELDIRTLKESLGQNILRIGRLQLGETATIKQICNHVAPQIGIDPKVCLGAILHLKEDSNEPR